MVTIMENQMEKKMENEMETGDPCGSYMTRQPTHANRSIEDVHLAFHVLVRIIPQRSKLPVCTLYPQYSKLDNSKQCQPSSSLAP